MKPFEPAVTRPVCVVALAALVGFASTSIQGGSAVSLRPGLHPRRLAVSGGGDRIPISSVPFTIRECGSYFLTRCLTGEAGADGVTIDADDVTLDLNGFTLIGVPGSLAGVQTTAGARNATIRGGTVRDWGAGGVQAFSESARVEDVRATGNLGAGIAVGLGGSVRGCSAADNQGDGFLLGFGSAIVDSVAVGNSGNGIHLAIAATATGCSAVACTVRTNGQAGVLGGDGCVVQSCSATLNGRGIEVGPGSVVEGCSAVFNGGDGIAAHDSLVRGNASRGNGGAQIDAPGSTVIENH